MLTVISLAACSSGGGSGTAAGGGSPKSGNVDVGGYELSDVTCLT
ncbi:MAG: hypothetical protein WD757_07210 [Actinomycetota bacterium]